MKILFILIIFLFSLSSLAQNISLKSDIVAGGQPSVSIKLIDIIEPSEAMSSFSDTLSRVQFINIDKEKSIELSRYELVAKLKLIKRKNKQLKSVNFVIPQKLKISHLGYNLNTRLVVESLKRAWQQKCSNCKFVVDSVVLPELSSQYKNEPWFIQESSSLPKGRFSAQIIFPNVTSPASVWVTGQSYTKKPVVVVGRNVEKGEFITDVPLVVKYRDIEKIRGALVSVSDLGHKVTNKYLMSGDIIKSTSLSDKIIFNRGDAVKLVYLDEGLRIVTTATADSIGTIGKSVWVKNLKSKKRISGVVSKTGEVLVR